MIFRTKVPSSIIDFKKINQALCPKISHNDNSRLSPFVGTPKMWGPTMPMLNSVPDYSPNISEDLLPDQMTLIEVIITSS